MEQVKPRATKTACFRPHAEKSARKVSHDFKRARQFGFFCMVLSLAGDEIMR